MEVRLTDIIAPPFYGVHHDILNGRHTYYDLYGGRGSTKSSFVSVEIVLGIVEDKNANAIIFRKVASTLRESVYEQIGWAIDALGLEDYFEATNAPMRYIFKETGQVIIFRGLDKAKKRKSIKCRRGYFKYLWFEELDEFAGEEEIRMTQQSVMRGGEKIVVFMTFNPPISISNWANVYVRTPNERALRHKSIYLDVPEDWLGREFIADAEHLKERNPRAYEHEYIGNPVGIGTNIFDQLEIREITDKEISKQERIYQGEDWGWYPDPKAFVRLSYNPKTERILIIGELGGRKIRNSEMAERIRSRGWDDFQIRCGVDEPQSIVDFRDAGLPAVKAVVTPGSVRYTHEWLQCRTIVIDPVRTPNLLREIIHYEHEIDKDGNVMSEYPDRDNHYIDAMRYAISGLAQRRGTAA